MDEFFKAVFKAPAATLFIVAGVFFLLIAVVGRISGKIEPDAKGRIASGVLGSIFVVMGVTMNLTQGVPQMPVVPAIPPQQTEHDQAAEIPRLPADRETEVASKASDSAPNTKEKESNDHVPAANLIAEGTNVRGSIRKAVDRDFFKIKISSNKTRLILRKTFDATVVVYDSVEETIVDAYAYGYETLSFPFKSQAGSYYYVEVNSLDHHGRGDYELLVQKE